MTSRLYRSDNEPLSIKSEWRNYRSVPVTHTIVAEENLLLLMSEVRCGQKGLINSYFFRICKSVIICFFFLGGKLYCWCQRWLLRNDVTVDLIIKGIQSLKLIFLVYIKSCQYSMLYTNCSWNCSLYHT